MKSTQKRTESPASEAPVEMRLARLESRTRQGRGWKWAFVGLLFAFAGLPMAADALGPVPNTFTDGGVVSAAEMNENFAYLQNAITDVEATVPSGAVMYFNASTCPAGWTELEAARGRTVVGMNGSAGTLAGTVGTALADMENRDHTHTTNIASVTTSSTGSHNHQWLLNGTTTYNSSGSGMIAVPPIPLQVGTLQTTRLNPVSSSDYYTDNDGTHTHTLNPPATASSASSTSDVVPYLQLLVCQRD
ncbi:MAG: hypothetical protein AB8I08_05650 [Sandaracinaceae bacterium]